MTMGRVLIGLAGVAAGGLLAACATAPQGPPLPPRVEEGKRLFARTCSGCHSADPARVGGHRAAPAFWRMAGVHTPESLQRAIADPTRHDPNGMPAVVLTRSEAEAVIAYIDAVGRADPATRKQLDIRPCNIATAVC